MTEIFADADEVKELTYKTACGQFQLGSHHAKNTNIGVPLREEDKKIFKNTSYDANSEMAADLQEAEEGIKRKVAQQKLVRAKITKIKEVFIKLKTIADKISQRGLSNMPPADIEFQKSNPKAELNTKLVSYRKEADNLRSAVTKLREEATKIKKHMEQTFKVKSLSPS